MSAVLQRPPSLAAPRRALGMVVAFLALLSGLAIGTPIAVPDASASLITPIGPNFLQPDGTCPPEGFLVQRPEGWTENGFLNRVDLVSGVVVESPLDHGMNGSGYNVLDDYIYGTTLDQSIPRGGITRIHGDGTQEYLGHPIGYPANQSMRWISGDINLNGRYVVGNGGDSDDDGFLEWFVVDMDPASATYFQVLGLDGADADTDIDPILVPAPVPALPGEFRGNPDLAYVGNVLYQIFREFRYDLSTPDPLDGEIVGMQLFRLNINPNTATGAYVDQGPITQNGQPFPDAGFGALYVDRINNHLYGSHNATGDIYRIDLDTREIVLFTDDEPTAQNDGARCQNAPLDIDWGDAPEIGYGTLAVFNGPRHTGLAGLALGATVDFERDATSNADASGDDATTSDDEDAFGPGPIVLNSNAPAVSVPYTNTTGVPVTVAGWIDLNGNGDFFDAGERQFVTVAPGNPVNLAWGPANGAGQNTFARFRLYQGTIADPQPLGPGTKGEVEDYPVTLTGGYVVSKSATVPSESVQAVGTQITYRITVTNQGSVPLPGGTFVDPLGDVLDDATMIAAPVASDGSAVGFDGSTISWNGTVPVGGLTVDYTVQINPTLNNGVLLNTVAGQCVGPPDQPPCGHRVYSGTYTVSKTADVPDQSVVSVGQTINYTITLTRSGNADVGAAVTDDLNAVLDDAALVSGPVVSDGSSASLAGGVLSWSGTIPVNVAAVTITYGVQVNQTLGDGLLRNAVVGLGCPAGTTTPPCASTHRSGTYTVSKSADVPDQSVVSVGQTINYTITLTRSGNADVGAAVTDDLNAVLDDAALVSGPVVSDGSSASLAGGVLSWSGTIPVNVAAVTITYGVQVNQTLGDGFLRNAVVGPGCAAGAITPPCAWTHRSGTYTVSKTADVPDQTTVPTGQVINYTIRVTRFGSADVGATFTDNLNGILDDATLVSGPAASDGSQVSLAGGVLSWSGTIPANVPFVDITYGVRVNNAVGDGFMENAVVGLGCPPGTTTPPCSTEYFTGSYTVAKTASPPSGTVLVPGQPVTYTIAVNKIGAGAVTGATFSDELSAVLDDATGPVNITASAGSAGMVGNMLQWSGNFGPGNASATITYTMTVKPANQLGDGVLTNGVTGPNCTPTTPGCFTRNEVRAWTVVKTSIPAPGTQVSPGSQIVYRLTISNTGGVAIPDAALTDNLGGVLDDATVTAGPTAGATINAGVLSWASALPVGQVGFIDYTVTLDAYADMGDGTLFNAVAAPEAGCPTPPITDPALPTYNPNCSTYHYTPVVSVTKASQKPNPIIPGSTVTYTITLTNTGTANVPAMTVTDDLTQVLDDSTFQGNPSANVGTASRNGNALTWTGPVAPGTPTVITYSVVVNAASAMGDGVLVNAAFSPRTNCCPPVRDPIEAWTYGKTSNPGTGAVVTPGDTITYTITATNTGGTTLTKSIVDDMSDVLDDATLTAGPTANIGTADFSDPNDTITWNGTFAPDEVVTITYTVTVRPAYQLGNGSIGNVATTTGGGECIVNCGGTHHDVRAWDVWKTASVVDVVPGGTVTYTIRVENTGDIPLTGLQWNDNLAGILDDAVVITEPSATVGSAIRVNDVIAWTGDLAVDQIGTITYTVRVNKPLSGDRSLTNAVFTPDGDGPCNATNPVPDRCRVDVPGKQLTIVKATEPADRETAVPGETVFYTLTITNSGDLDYPTASGDVAMIEDDLSGVLDDANGPTPAQITVTGPGAASFDANTGLLSWTGPIAVDQVVVVRYGITVHPVVTGDAHLLNVVASNTPGSLCPDPAVTDPQAPGYDPNCVKDTPISAYEIDKTSDPADGSEVEPGDQITYTVTLTNTGDVDLGDPDPLVVTDDLSGVLDDATLDGDPVASDGDAAVTGDTMTWTGELPIGAVVTVTYTVTVNPSDEFGDAIIGNLVAGSGPTDCPEPAVVDPQAPGYNPDCLTSSKAKGYTIVKTADPVAGTAVVSGDEVTYTVTLTNTGEVDLTDLEVTDSLTDVLDDADVTTEPTADAGTVERLDDVITWTGDLDIGEVVVITYSVTVQPVLDLGDGNLGNVVTGTGPVQCPDPPITDPDDPDFDPNCYVAVPVDAYTIVKSSDPADDAVVQPFDRITYTLTLTSVGLAPSLDLTVTDSLTDVLDDADLDGAPTASSGAVSVTGAVLSWTGDLAAGEVVTVTYVAVVKAPTALGDSHIDNVVVGSGNTSCPEAVEPDPDAPLVVPNADCSTEHDVAAYTTLKEVVSPAAPRPGDQVTYRVTITSVGSAPIVGETISDDLAGVLDDAVWDNTAAYVGGNPATLGALSFTAPTLSWTGDIAVDDVLIITYSITLHPQLTGDGHLRNVVISNDCPFATLMGGMAALAFGDMPPGCKTDTAIPSVVFTKSVSPAGPFKPGDVVTYTITATNNGQADVDAVTWSDDMTRVLDDADMVGQPSSDRGAVSFSTPMVTWTGSLAVGEVAHVTYQVTIRADRGDGSMPNGVVGIAPGSNCPTVGAGVECLTLALVLPPGVDLDPTDPGELPRTGGNTTGIVLVASMLLAAGVGLIAVRRRRRSITV